MGERMELIPFITTQEEEARHRLLEIFSRRASTVLTNLNIPRALKGGTALQIGYGLTRPSTDADFEADEKISPKLLTREAFSGQKEYKLLRLGVNWLRRGSIRIAARERATGQTIDIGLDYRVSGTMPGMSPRVPMDQTVVYHGIRMFDLPTMTDRKLNALIGEKPRKQPRDVYDATFLVQHHPEALTNNHWTKLTTWVGELTETDRRAWRARFIRDDVMSRAKFDQVVDVLEQELSIHARTGTAQDLDGYVEPTTRELALAEGTQAPEAGPIEGQIAELFVHHADRIPAVMMGENDNVIFGLSTKDGRVTPLYTITRGQEQTFEAWMEQHAHLWGRPLGDSSKPGGDVSSTVAKYREETLSAARGMNRGE